MLREDLTETNPEETGVLASFHRHKKAGSP